MVHGLGVVDVGIYGGRFVDSIAWDDLDMDVMSISGSIHLKSGVVSLVLPAYTLSLYL